jgi:hypothetical protein
MTPAQFLPMVVGLLSHHTPLVHPARVGTRWTAFRTPPVRSSILDDDGKIASLVFGKMVKSTEQAEKTANLVTLLSRAVVARGKADMDAVRAVATLVGAEGDLDSFEASIGVNSTSSDKSGQVVNNLFELGGAALSSLTARLDTPRERRQTLLLSVALSVLICEFAQAAIVIPISWLLGAGLSAAPGGQLPFAAAADHTPAAPRR